MVREIEWGKQDYFLVLAVKSIHLVNPQLLRVELGPRCLLCSDCWFPLKFVFLSNSFS